MNPVFNLVRVNDGESWVTKKKFPSGMTGVFSMEVVEDTGKALTFNAYLYLTRKRKKMPEFREVTGRDNLQPAIWVLEALEHFEKIAPDLYSGSYVTRIEVFADDDRRWKIYERILTKKGYAATMVNNTRTLVKRLESK